MLFRVIGDFIIWVVRQMKDLKGSGEKKTNEGERILYQDFNFKLTQHHLDFVDHLTSLNVNPNKKG